MEMHTVVGGHGTVSCQRTRWIEEGIDPIENLVRSVLSIGGGEIEQMEAIAPDYPSTLFTVLEERGRLQWFHRKTATEARNLRTIRGNPSRISFPENSFDLVGCQFLLNLPLDPEPIIRETVRICAPGGQILLQDLTGPPAESWFTTQFSDPVLAEVDQVLRELEHVLFFGSMLSRSLEKAGIDDLRVSVQSCPTGEDWKLSLERRLWQHKLYKAVPIALTRIDDDVRSVDEIVETFLDRMDPESGRSQPVMCSVLAQKPIDGI